MLSEASVNTVDIRFIFKKIYEKHYKNLLGFFTNKCSLPMSCSVRMRDEVLASYCYCKYLFQYNHYLGVKRLF